MKPIIFVRVTDMKYYKGITEQDTPVNGGSYVKETNYAHECYNFDAVCLGDDKEKCLGYTQLLGGNGNGEIQLHIEKIVGCEKFEEEDVIDEVIVVWCSKARDSQNMRVVGFYKHAKAFRHQQYAEFDNDFLQAFSFESEKENCVLLPYRERHTNNKWYVPTSGKNGSTFGFGHLNIWYAGSDTESEKEKDYVDRMITNIENYDGENWIDKGGVQ